MPLPEPLVYVPSLFQKSYSRKHSVGIQGFRLEGGSQCRQQYIKGTRFWFIQPPLGNVCVVCHLPFILWDLWMSYKFPCSFALPVCCWNRNEEVVNLFICAKKIWARFWNACAMDQAETNVFQINVDNGCNSVCTLNNVSHGWFQYTQPFKMIYV